MNGEIFINPEIVHGSAAYTLGQRAFDHLGNEYAFVKAGSDIGAIRTCAFDAAGDAVEISASTGTGTRAGTSRKALRSGEYGWLQLYGHGPIGAAAGTTEHAVLYLAGTSLPTMERFSRGSISNTDSTVTIAQYRARCVSANSQAFTAPSPITSGIVPPVADNYILRQRFLLKLTTRWTRLQLVMGSGCDDALALFLVQSDSSGTPGTTVIGSARQHVYSPSSVTINSATFLATDAVWGAPDSNGFTWAMIETYFIEVSGGQIATYTLGYTPATGAVVAPRTVNAVAGLPTESLASHGSALGSTGTKQANGIYLVGADGAGFMRYPWMS